MTQNNNLSVLPFYTDIQQQNHRKSYAYGAIYPLFAPANMLIPFQIIREHREKIDTIDLPKLNEFKNYYLTATGVAQADVGFDVTEFDVSTTEKRIYIDAPNASYIYSSAVVAIAFDSNHNVISVLDSPGNWYEGYWEFPDNTASIMVQTKSTNIQGEIKGVFVNQYPINNVTLYDKNGGIVQDITPYMLEVGLRVVPFPALGYDVIVFPATLTMPTNMFDGIYYIELSDGVQTWYSEMFTIVQDVRQYLKIEWYDKENFVFDAGQIVYENPAFKNVLYLCTELGKPDYQFEEEAEKRNGYLFSTKQISEKTYKCTILAPEFLCDSMRLIRMSDYVRVTDKYGRVYDCDQFLITPKWQTQGDLASVEIEFETNTVVKKLGKGYIVRDIGDYNIDYNNDYNK